MSATALATAVTGLKVHQRKLDVVASNISNVNTTGYRSSRVVFQDLFSQTIRGGSAAVGDFGGTNPQQIGLGVQIASIDVNQQQGSLVTTGISSDLAVQGNGFFVLSDGTGTQFTRDGSFELNPDGLLIDPATGRRVQGFLADDQGNFPDTATPTDIEIPVGATGIVRETDNATLVGNLNPTREEGVMTPKVVTRTIEVFDSLGTSRVIDLTFTQDLMNDNTWSLTASFNGTDLLTDATIEFNPDGTVASGGTQTLTIAGADLSMDGPVPEDLEFTLDLTEVTQLASGDSLESDIALQNQDGFPRGVLESFNIGGNGDINGVFSNGLTLPIAQVALANFSNVGGLSRDGQNAFVQTPASGPAQVGPPNTGGRGSVNGGVLENSNVDLGDEFSDLIIAQRGFQANARTVTTADTILGETVNLIR